MGQVREKGEQNYKQLKNIKIYMELLSKINVITLLFIIMMKILKKLISLKRNEVVNLCV